MTTLTRLATAACAGTLLLTATACGSSARPTADQAPAAGSAQAGSPGGRSTFPGASGEIAAVDGSTAQVQNPQAGQVAVTWNDATTFTKQVTAGLADVAVGSCVTVQSGAEAGSGDASPVAATTVRISEPVDGSCIGGGLGGRGAGGEPPAGVPSPPEGRGPRDGARPEMRRLGGAFGEVTAVTSDGFSFTSQRPGGDEAETVAVTVSAQTTYTRQAAGSAADVKVGSCATARGQADDTGAITAETIAISPQQDGSCGMVVMRGGARPGGSGQAQES